MSLARCCTMPDIFVCRLGGSQTCLYSTKVKSVMYVLRTVFLPNIFLCLQVSGVPRPAMRSTGSPVHPLPTSPFVGTTSYTFNLPQLLDPLHIPSICLNLWTHIIYLQAASFVHHMTVNATRRHVQTFKLLAERR